MFLVSPLSAQNWPQWRGPNRDGHVEDFAAPAKWPDSLKLVWKIEVGAGLSSPVVADGRIYLLTRENLAGIAVESGRQLWSFLVESDAQIITPIVFEDLVIFSIYRGPMTAVKIKKEGARWSAEQAWITNEITLEMSTPVLVGDKLYGLSYAKRGQFFALDARSGKTMWTSEGRQAESAAVLNAKESLIALTNEAKLVALARSETEYKPLAIYEVADSPTWAHPVLWGKHILVKDETHLACLRLE
jgi:outer membrane protein assembly factor BamB